MGIQKKAKLAYANVKEKVEHAKAKGNMQMTDLQESNVPPSDGLPEDMRRNAAPTFKYDPNEHRNGSISGPVATTASLNATPPVPPHTTPSLSTASAPGDDTLTRGRPNVTRRPTQQDEVMNQSSKASEKPLPPLNATLSPEPTLSEELLGKSNDNDEMDIRTVEETGDSGKTLVQVVEEQSLKLQEQAKDINDLRKYNYQCINQIETLKDDLQKEKQKHAQTTQEWRKATVALSANRPEPNYKVDDDTLRRDYQNIAYDIGSWVVHYCVQNFDCVSKSHLKVFNKLTLDPEKYFHVERTRQLLLQSLIMHTLVEWVLNRGLLWVGKESVGLEMVQRALELEEPRVIPTLLKNKSVRLADVRDYSAWKAKTALLLSEKANKMAIQANVVSVSADMQELLKPFVQRNMTTAWNELEDVIRKTIAFDLELNKSRALFQVHRWSARNIEEMRFEESCMASPNGLKAARSGMEVELVLSPMITKTGNADGDAFECLTLISPWTVVCRENRKQMKKK